MRILKISLTRLRNEEWFRLYTDLRELVLRFGASVLDIVPLFTLLESLYEKADNLLLVLQKSVHTEAIKQADEERDALFRGFLEAISCKTSAEAMRPT
jgi:hypothetical protein